MDHLKFLLFIINKKKLIHQISANDVEQIIERLVNVIHNRFLTLDLSYCRIEEIASQVLIDPWTVLRWLSDNVKDFLKNYSETAIDAKDKQTNWLDFMKDVMINIKAASNFEQNPQTLDSISFEKICKELIRCKDQLKAKVLSHMNDELVEPTANNQKLLQSFRTSALLSGVVNMKIALVTFLPKSQISTLQLSDILPKLNWIENLKLQGNNLTEIPNAIQHLTQLRALELDNNQISVIPEWIGNLGQLKKLGLRNNKIISLPLALGSMQFLSEIQLDNNPNLQMPPPFVVKEGTTRIISYMKSLSEGISFVYHTNLTVIGEEGSGKSSLLRHIQISKKFGLQTLRKQTLVKDVKAFQKFDMTLKVKMFSLIYICGYIYTSSI